MKLSLILFLIPGLYASGYQLRGLKSRYRWRQWLSCGDVILVDRGSAADDDNYGRRGCMTKLEKELKKQLNVKDIKIHRFASDRYSNDVPPETKMHPKHELIPAGQRTNIDDKELIYIHECNSGVIKKALNRVASTCLEGRNCGSIHILLESSATGDCAKDIQRRFAEGDYQINVDFDGVVGATAQNYTKYFTRYGLESQIDTFFIDKDTECNAKYVDKVYCDIEDEIWKLLPSPLARACSGSTSKRNARKVSKCQE